MKILVIFNHPAPYKVALFNGLAKHHEIHVIFERFKARNRHQAFYNEQDFSFTLHKIKGISLGNENHLSWGVKKHLKQHKYDLIIVNGYSTFTEMIALRYLKRKKIPYAFYINGGIVKKEVALKKKIKTYFIKGAKYYFSPALKANEYLLHYGAKKENIFNYPYSTVYQKDVLKEPVSSVVKQLYWQNAGVKALNHSICVTSFIPRKNNMSLIKGWAKAPRDYALILVGEGPEKKVYDDLVRSLELHNVYFLPFAKKAKIFEYLTHSDNAIYISNYDIYGHVVNEALAHGLNVLTNKNMIASVELIKNGENGLIIDRGENYADYLPALFSASFFSQAVESAKTIEHSVIRHLEILEKFV